MPKKLKIIRVTTKPIALSILLKGQLKYINNFHEVIGVSSPGIELKDVNINEGIKTISLYMSRKISPLKDIISLIGMIKILLREKPDVVHSHTPKAGVISMLASYICKIPNRFHTVAGLPLMEAKGMKRQLLIFVEWITYMCATKVYPNSNGLMQFISNNISVSKNKMMVIGSGSSNGIDVNLFDRNNKTLKMYNITKKSLGLLNIFTFIFIGRIVKEKGIEELVEAFVKLNSKFTDTRLLILGYEEKDLDPISDETRKIIKINRNINNLGFKKDIRPFLAASDCLVLPSYREGFPNVVLQAGSMQVPSIVSDINGCNEIIHNDINGLLVQPKNIESLHFAMKKILLDKKLYDSMVRLSRKNIIDNFTKDIFFKKVLLQYSNLIRYDRK